MRSDQVLDYKFILVYEDQFSQFIILRPLESGDAKDVAMELFDILAIIGAPLVLQSGNSRKFASEIVHELRLLWPDLVMVHGDVAISSAGSKRDFIKLLKTWLTQNPARTWCEGLRFVQINENKTLHCEAGKTPHELLFVNNGNVELKLMSVTNQTMRTVWSEEDWQKVINDPKDQNQTDDETTKVSVGHADGNVSR